MKNFKRTKKEKVILLQDSKIGKKHETKEITRGFANYLWKQEKFLFATPKNLIWVEEQKLKKEQESISVKEKTQSLYQKINNLTISFTQPKNKEGKLFGSVNFKEILVELKKMDFHLTRSQLIDLRPLNQLGENIVKVKLSSDLIASLRVIIN